MRHYPKGPRSWPKSSTRNKLNLVLTGALASQVACLSNHEFGANAHYAESGYKIRACDTEGPHGNIRFYRLGDENGIPECYESATAFAFHGVSTEGPDWAPTIYELYEQGHKELVSNTIVYDLAGQGLSGAAGLEEVNPLNMAQALRGLIKQSLAPGEKGIFIGLSAGAAVAALVARDFTQSTLITFNPVLAPDHPEMIRSMSRNAPYSCNLRAAPYIIHKGATHSNQRPSGSGLIDLKKESVRDVAQSSNVCLEMVDEVGHSIGQACEHAFTDRLAQRMHESCETITDYVDSVRKKPRIEPWSRELNLALHNRNARGWPTFVYLSGQDDVLNPFKLAPYLIENYPSFHVEWVNGPHELMTAMPRQTASNIYMAVETSQRTSPALKE